MELRHLPQVFLPAKFHGQRVPTGQLVARTEATQRARMLSRSVASVSAASRTQAARLPVRGLSSQEYWGGLPCPPPGDLPDPGVEPTSLISPALQVDLSLSHPGSRRDRICARKLRYCF